MLKRFITLLLTVASLPILIACFMAIMFAGLAICPVLWVARGIDVHQYLDWAFGRVLNPLAELPTRIAGTRTH